MLIIFKLVVIKDEEKLNMSRITCEEGGRKVHEEEAQARAPPPPPPLGPSPSSFWYKSLKSLASCAQSL